MSHATTRSRPHPKASPTTDPRFQKVMGNLKQGAARTKRHAPAAKKSAEASAAAKGPLNEKAAGAKSKQVDKLKDAPAKKPETNSFLEMLRSEIQAAMPKTLDDTDDFMKGDTPGAMKSSLKGNVSKETGKAAGDIKGASQGKPNDSGVAVKEVTGIPKDPTLAPPSVDGAQAMPAPKPDAEVSLQDSKQDTEAEMAENHITPLQLKKANDPRFSAVLSAKDAVAKQADAAPAQYRAGEKGVLSAAASQAQAQGKKGALALIGVRGKLNSAVLTRQQAAQAKEEFERKQVTDHIEGIYNSTKETVDAKLAALETEVGTMFDSGIDNALATMTSFVEARLKEYKDERYSGVLGKGRWLKDKFFSLPHEADIFYTQGRNVFTRTMDALVVQVAARVELRLKEAKDEVAKGKTEIAKYVDGLKPSLKNVGNAAEKDMASRFQELEQGIDSKKGELAQSLAQKYKDAYGKADEALKKIQDSNKGLVTAFVEKLSEIVKILLEFKDKLMALIKKAASVIGLIVDDPIGFLGNLISAIKLGIQQFVSNIWTHLKNGFMQWLFGSLADAGIELPKDLSLPSILKLVLGVLGITYERMRAKAVKLIGERNVKIIEKLGEYLKELITGGPAALWAKMKEDLGNLKEMVIDALQNWLIETIVKRAVAKIVLLFNPVGAIIQAIMAIYDVITFLIDKATQIMAFVESVIDSVALIVAGSIGSAANKIEASLASIIPLLIGFLADFIGLGGITKKIKETITKVQSTVDKAIDKVIAKAVGFVRSLLGGGKGKEDATSDPEKEKKVQVALSQLDAEDRSHARNGKLARKDVEAIASKVKANNPVLKSIAVKTEGTKWIYEYVASPAEDYEAGEMDADQDSAEDQLTPALWQEALDLLVKRGSPGNVSTRLSAVSFRFNRALLLGYIQQSSYAGLTEKAQAQATVETKLKDARASRNGDEIYQDLAEAARAVKAIYPEGALSLEVHHVEQVKDNPVTFLKTRAERARPKIAARIKKAEEEAIRLKKPPPVFTPEIRREMIQSQLDEDTTEKPHSLREVEMQILTRALHTGRDGIHPTENRDKKKNEREVYTPRFGQPEE